MLEALDVDVGGAVYLPWAQNMLRKLKMDLNARRVDYGRKELPTPDGNGRVDIRTRRSAPGRGYGVPFSPDQQIDDWYDYIRIEAGTSHFVFAPFIKPRSALIVDAIPLPNARMSVKVPFNYAGRAALQPFDRFQSVSRVIELPHSTPSQSDRRIITGANEVPPAIDDLDPVQAQSVRAALVTQEDTAFFNFGGTDIRGVFRHQYTDDEGVPQVKLLAITNAGVIRDTTNGATLTAGGDALSGELPCTWVADRTGRKVVLSFARTGLSAPIKQFLLDVDFTAVAQQVTRTDITGAITGSLTTITSATVVNGGFANGTSDTATSVSSNSQGQICKGVSAAGEQVEITVEDTTSTSGTTHLEQGGPDSCVAVGALTNEQLFAIRELVNRTGLVSESSLSAAYRTITMPGGFSVTFTITEDSTIEEQTGDIDFYVWFYTIVGTSICRGHPQDGAWNSLSVDSGRITNGGFRVIYADPSIPILFYEWAYVDRTIRFTQRIDYEGLAVDPASVLATANYTHTSTLVTDNHFYVDVGVITDDEHTVLVRKENVESTTIPSSSTGVVTVTEPGPAEAGAFSVFPQGVFYPASSSTSSSVTDPTSNVDDMKQLRRVHAKLPDLPSGNMGAFGYTGIKYVVAAKSKRDWILGATKGNIPETGQAATPLDVTDSFDVWAGRINRERLREKFLEYLGNSLAVTQPVISADVLAGALDDYEIKLGYDHVGSYI